jgi:hypothetical protein
MGGFRCDKLVVIGKQGAHYFPFFSVEQELPGFYAPIRFLVVYPEAIIERNRRNGVIIPDSHITVSFFRLLLRRRNKPDKVPVVVFENELRIWVFLHEFLVSLGRIDTEKGDAVH